MLSQDYPVRQVCRVLEYARSRHDYRPRTRAEAPLRAAIVRLAEAWPTYGYRRLTALLHREGLQVNRQHVARLMREMRLQGQRRRRGPRTTHSGHADPRYPNLVQGLTVVRPAQVWVGDITYVRLRDEFGYLAVFREVYSRGLRGWHLSRHLDQSLTLTAVQRALVHYRPEIHHSDQGVQYAATASIHTLRAHEVQISMAAIGEATEKGYAERLMRTIKEAEVTLHEYANFRAAYQPLGRFLDEVYQHKRIHSALGDLTPAEFEAEWQQRQARATSVPLETP
jgi:putative transposase